MVLLFKFSASLIIISFTGVDRDMLTENTCIQKNTILSEQSNFIETRVI